MKYQNVHGEIVDAFKLIDQTMLCVDYSDGGGHQKEDYNNAMGGEPGDYLVVFKSGEMRIVEGLVFENGFLYVDEVVRQSVAEIERKAWESQVVKSANEFLADEASQVPLLHPYQLANNIGAIEE
ncbi:hypothetical protein D3C74_50280 [compost metagenome]